MPGGAPCWTYEVEWQGNYKNSFEPAACLVGWEKEMKEVDEKVAQRLLLPKVKPAAEALKAREAAAKKKAEDTQKRVVRLKRLKARRARARAMQKARVATKKSSKMPMARRTTMTRRRMRPSRVYECALYC